MIERLRAKIEYHQMRDECDEVDKLREQIQAIVGKAALMIGKLKAKQASGSEDSD
jgi:hypothetical protein